MVKGWYAQLVLLLVLSVGAEAQASSFVSYSGDEGFGGYGIYDAFTGIFDMSATAPPTRLQLYLRRDLAVTEGLVEGNLTFQFSFDNDGNFGAGVFALFGTSASLGITTPAPLIVATVTGADFDVRDVFTCGENMPIDSSHCPDGTQQGDVAVFAKMETLFAHELIRPYWQTQMEMAFLASTRAGFLPFSGPLLNDETVYQYSWDGRQADYWWLWTSGSYLAPEPGTFGLLSFGLLGLGFTARRRLH